MTIFDDFDLGKESARLLKLYPRYFPDSTEFTLVESSPDHIYTIDLIGLDITEVEVNGVGYNKVDSIDDLSITVDQFFLDRDEEKLYIIKTGALISTDTIVITYALCFASFDTVFHLEPTSSITPLVFYEGKLISNPSLRKGLDSQVSGFIPSYSSSVELSNADGEYNFILNDNNTLSQAQVEIFLGSRPLDATKVIKTFTGFINKVEFNDESIRVNFSDIISLFNKNVPLIGGHSTVSVENYPDVALSNVNFNIREVYGRKDFIRCLNVDADKVSSPKNPSWVICKNVSQAGISPIILLQVNASPAPTTTRFYYTITSILSTISIIPQPGDIMHATTVGAGATDIIVTGIDIGAGFIDYEAVATPPVAGKIFERDRIGNIYAYRNIDGVFVRQTYLSRGVGSTHTLRGAISLDTTARAIDLTVAHDPSDLLGSSDIDILVARVYGETLLPQVNVSSSRSPSTGTFSKWFQEILNVLTRKLRVQPDQIDDDAITEANLTTQEVMSFTLPFDFQSQMPNVRDLIALIANSVNAQVFTLVDGRFSFKKIGLPDENDALTITKDDIISGSFDFSLNYDDLLNNMTFSYKKEDFSGTTALRLIEGDSFQFYRETFAKESQLYKSESTTEKESLCLNEADVIANAAKQKAIYAYPIGIFSIQLPLSFANVEIGQTFRIERSILPTLAGIADDKFIYADVINVTIGQNSVSFQMWDKQGIIKNEGDF